MHHHKQASKLIRPNEYNRQIQLIMSEKFQADPAHVKCRAGWINRQRHEITVVGILSDSVQQRVAHRWHELREHNRIPELLVRTRERSVGLGGRQQRNSALLCRGRLAFQPRSYASLPCQRAMKGKLCSRKRNCFSTWSRNEQTVREERDRYCCCCCTKPVRRASSLYVDHML